MCRRVKNPPRILMHSWRSTDALIERVSGLNDFLQEASNTAARATRSEIVIRSTVDVSALQKQADELSKQLRELDVRIQGLNWTTELK